MSTQIVLATKDHLVESTDKFDGIEMNSFLTLQKEYFNTEATKSIEFRIHQLKKLKKLIRQYEDQILEALKQDLGRDPMEGYISEIMFLINEINFAIKKLKSWTRPKQIDNSFFLFPASSKVYHEPYGVCLIISPWNYPFFLSIRPLIGAMSAGNCVTLKCSETSPNTNEVILEMINQNFPQEYLYAIDCQANETEQLIESGYDFILFTGSSETGKKVMQSASHTLTPLVLELGGKCPVIVDETANINLAAKKIVWGKFINAGQTCIAPDHVYVHISRKNDLIKAIENQIVKLYGKDPLNNPDLGKIINAKHFQRLINLLEESKIIWGGNIDEEKLKIEPTLIEADSPYEKIMKEEIFGPLLPILTYKDLDILVNQLKKLPKPLSLYHFSRDKTSINKVNKSLSFGGGCVNDCMMHITNKFLPFGGVGASGFGSYVGEQGFKTFSHAKSMVERGRFMLFDFLPLMPAYTEGKFKLFKTISKFIGY